MECKEALIRLQEYLDGEISALTRDEVREHFEKCDRCYPHLRLEESFRDAVQRVTKGEAAPPGLRDRLLAAIAEEEEAGG